jgi:hypothetical protein
MKKIVIESPWGNFLKLHIGKRVYSRSAIGNFWKREGKPPMSLWGCDLLSLIAYLLPVSEVEPDRFSDMLRATIPPERLGWMKPTSTNGL